MSTAPKMHDWQLRAATLPRWHAARSFTGLLGSRMLPCRHCQPYTQANHRDRYACHVPTLAHRPISNTPAPT